MMRKRASLKAVLFMLFFLSGACGLVYEVVWARMLALVFGATVFAISTVLISFMAGLALGSLSFGRLVDRSPDPLKIYAYLEAGVGVFALFVPLIFARLDTVYVYLHRQVHASFYLFSLIRFLFSFLVLVVPATLMGGTLPAMSKYFVTRLGDLGWDVGRLYSINTFGAVVGCSSTGFLLLGTLGIRGTIFTAASVNLLIAATVLIISRARGSAGGPVAGGQAEAEDRDRGGYDPAYPLSFALWGVAISGFAALAYEVVWTRVLTVLFPTTTYSFTVMLTTFLCGLALGSFLFARLIDRKRDLLGFFGLVQIAIGLSAILLVPILGKLPALLLALRGRLGMSWPKMIGMTFGSSFLVMLIPTILMGTTFPLVSKMCTLKLRGLGRSIGKVYSANTLGAIVGSFGAGFLLIPLIGAQRSNLWIAFLNLFLGTGALLINPWMRPKLKWIGVGAVSLIVLATGIILPARMRPIILPSGFGTVGKEVDLVYYDEGMAGTVTVVEEGGVRSCCVDNSFVCGTSYDALQTVRMLGHLPLLVHPRARKVLVIGFGIGVTTSAVARHPVEAIDCVEISPEVVAASRYFREVNHDVLSDPRVSLTEGDGRNYVLATADRYDVITCDPTHPLLGSGGLYTKEYWELCRKRLKPDGIMCQYLPLHLLSPQDFRTIINTFHKVFPNTTLWFTFSHCILFGGQQPLAIDFNLLNERLRQREIAEDLVQSNLEDPFAFLSCLILDEEAVGRFVRGASTNTDDHPYVEFSGRRSMGAETWTVNLSSLAELRVNPSGVLTNLGPNREEAESVERRLGRYFQAGAHKIQGLIFWRVGAVGREIEEYGQALEINPEDREVRLLLQKALKRAGRTVPGD